MILLHGWLVVRMLLLRDDSASSHSRAVLQWWKQRAGWVDKVRPRLVVQTGVSRCPYRCI